MALDYRDIARVLQPGRFYQTILPRRGQLDTALSLLRGIGSEYAYAHTPAGWRLLSRDDPGVGNPMAVREGVACRIVEVLLAAADVKLSGGWKAMIQRATDLQRKEQPHAAT